MKFSYNRFSRMEPAKLYLARPGRQRIGVLEGICSAHLTAKFNDLWELSVEIDARLNEEANPLYEEVIHFMEIFIENVGWFRINSYPTEMQDADGRVCKTFTAYSYETNLQDKDLNSFSINCGTNESWEMYEENYIENGDGSHRLIKNICFYIPEESDDPNSPHYYRLGLINILRRHYLGQWKIGAVDPELAKQTGQRFEINSQDVYSFLTQNVSAAYQCVFEFDSLSQTIHIYGVNSREFGRQTNIYLNYRNLLQSAVIRDAHDAAYTRFRVQGGNEETTIPRVNFGSETIDNLHYVLACGLVGPELTEKYGAYEFYRDGELVTLNEFTGETGTRRQLYTELSKQYTAFLIQKRELEERAPTSEALKNWRAYSLEELRAEFDHYETILERLVEFHEGTDIAETLDYAQYLTIRDVVIPSILAEIDRKETGALTAEEINIETNWVLYGLLELQIRRNLHQTLVDSYQQSGFGTPLGETLPDGYAGKHALYLQEVTYVKEIDAAIAALKPQIEFLQQELNALSSSLRALEADCSIHHARFGFTEEDLRILDALTVQTDYTDSSIETLDTDDALYTLVLLEKLYQSAARQLEIESQPQFTFEITMDNLFQLSEYACLYNDFELGNFIYLELQNDYLIQPALRMVEFGLELVNLTNPDFTVTFSNQITAYGKADDYAFLFEGSNGSSKNSISRSSGDRISAAASAAANSVLKNYLQVKELDAQIADIKYANVQELSALKGSFVSLLTDYLKTGELEARVADIQSLSADSAFIDYLNSQYIRAAGGDFNTLQAELANVRTLLSGQIGAADLTAIYLTADNVVIDDMVIQNGIAKRIAVGDLKGDRISTDQFEVSSDKGLLQIKGNTQQFLDQDGRVRIQMGQDAEGNFNFIVRGEDGTTALFDENGITADAVADGLILNHMIGAGTLSKDRLNFPVVETDENGNVSITKIYDGEGGNFGAAYTDFKTQVKEESQSVKDTMGGISALLDSVNRQFSVRIWQEDIETAIDRNDGEIRTSINELTTNFNVQLEQIKGSVQDITYLLENEEDPNSLTLLNRLSEIVLNSDRFEVRFTEMKDSLTYDNDYIESLRTRIVSNKEGIIIATSVNTDTNVTQLHLGSNIIEFQETNYIDDPSNTKSILEKKTLATLTGNAFQVNKVIAKNVEVEDEMVVGSYKWITSDSNHFRLIYVDERVTAAVQNTTELLEFNSHEELIEQFPLYGGI